GTQLSVVVADANDPASILFTESIPADHFTTRGTHTTYDRLGTFPGRVTLRNSKKQADTVVVSVRVAAAVVGVGIQRDLRVSFNAGGRSARTCVSPCNLAHGKLRCRGSVGYLPFADQGFGAYL